jgi:hypothetical protein
MSLNHLLSSDPGLLCETELFRETYKNEVEEATGLAVQTPLLR